MNNKRIASLLRQLADEFDSGQKTERGSVARSYNQEETLREFLPEDEWSQFDHVMMFGKHAGMPLLEVPTSYLKYLGRQDFEGNGTELGDAIELAIEYLDNPSELDRHFKGSTPADIPSLGKDDPLDEDVPF